MTLGKDVEASELKLTSYAIDRAQDYVRQSEPVDLMEAHGFSVPFSPSTLVSITRRHMSCGAGSLEQFKTLTAGLHMPSAKMEKIRKASHAGSWYTDDRKFRQATVYKTPIGDLPIDEEDVEKLID
ncbi:hypothetical protein RND71_035358 [Anisodus tanguticus]|uniref:Uncharacterized protein n=1 Tax=Anisodus tanguticus TaxID=243964 RepID=A0AAE1R7I7_9SOLA|nr:hypothetical protein RND71_035358 [Anisodus tanguticus]